VLAESLSGRVVSQTVLTLVAAPMLAAASVNRFDRAYASRSWLF
jgi:hypothetical protein